MKELSSEANAENPIDAQFDADSVWATALVISILRKRFADDEPTWRLLVEKACRFVRKFQVTNRLMSIDIFSKASEAISN